MPAKPRPASNNVIACLEDIVAVANDTLPIVCEAGERAEERYQDPVMLGKLVRIERALNTILLHARNARSNRYEPRRAA